MEGAIAAVAGNAAVGFLAQNLFGYNLADADPDDKSQSEQNAEALGKSLALTSVLPWTLCLTCYIFMHWAFPYDKRMIEEEKAKYKAQHGQLLSESTSASEDELDGDLDREAAEDENLEWLEPTRCG